MHRRDGRSFGLCGKASLDVVYTTVRWNAAEDHVLIGSDTAFSPPDRLRAAQRVFDTTGGLHAIGLFTAGGGMLCVREDVGRNHAVAKVIGHAPHQALLPLWDTVPMVSGPASFELIRRQAWPASPY